MKHRITIVFLLPLFTLILNAQDYQTVTSNRISYFEGEAGYISCIKIDSVTFDADSILYPMKSIRQVDYECYTPYGDAWIGGKIIVKDNGTNLFFNKYRDTIRIETQAKLHDEWTAFHLQDSLTIKATISKHDTMEFLGLVDSVKTIDFTAYDKYLNPVEINSRSNWQMKISKNHGLIQTFDKYYFALPYKGYSLINEQNRLYTLVGLSAPEVGFQNITWFDVNNFQPNDEIHIIEKDVDSEGPEISRIINKIRYKYLSRSETDSSINYSIERTKSISKQFNDSSFYSYSHDTIISTVYKDTIFDMLPGQPIIDDYTLYQNIMTREMKSNTDNVSAFGGEDSCWYEIIYDGCWTEHFYSGLGGPYYYCDYLFTMGYSERKLVYYKKGNVEWGTPLVITAVDEKHAENNAKLYPNPASDFVTIEKNTSTKDLFFELTDLNGRKILSRILDSNIKQIELKNLEPGIYLYTIRNSNTVYKTDKLIMN